MMRKLIELLALSCAKSLVFLMQWLPEKLAYPIARAIFYCVEIFMPRLRGVARRNLEIAFPEMTPAEREGIVVRSFQILARNLIAYSRLPRLSKAVIDKKYTYDEAAVILKNAREMIPGTGILMPTAHFGLFEELVQVGAVVDKPVAILARGFGLPKLDRWWNSRREIFGNEVFFRKGGYNQIVKRISNGQDVTLLCDQNVKSNHAVYVDFFGIPAATTKTMALAAIRTGCQTVFVISWKNGEEDYEILAKRIPHPSEFPGDSDSQIAGYTRALNEVLEDCIRAHPDHWFWIHRRFKTRPPGEPETIYADR